MSNQRMRHAAASLAVLAFLAAAPSVAFAADAPGPKDRAALRVRVLQSDMMVAALSCDLRDSYNVAVRRFQAELVLHGRNLRAYFDRTHNGKGQRALDRFVTAMANQASSRAVVLGDGYCTAAANMMHQVLALPPNSLAEFSRGVVDLAAAGIPDLVASAPDTKN